jgi:hypothetical protein
MKAEEDLYVIRSWVELRPVSQSPADGASSEAAGPEESAGGVHRPLARSESSKSRISVALLFAPDLRNAPQLPEFERLRGGNGSG